MVLPCRAYHQIALKKTLVAQAQPAERIILVRINPSCTLSYCKQR